eukprot:SAG11_NODE_3291_length_2550_cov_1.922073_1_plen_57_part_00
MHYGADYEGKLLETEMESDLLTNYEATCPRHSLNNVYIYELSYELSATSVFDSAAL